MRMNEAPGIVSPLMIRMASGKRHAVVAEQCAHEDQADEEQREAVTTSTRRRRGPRRRRRGRRRSSGHGRRSGRPGAPAPTGA